MLRTRMSILLIKIIKKYLLFYYKFEYLIYNFMLTISMIATQNKNKKLHILFMLMYSNPVKIILI